jgi:hypothetical protein
MKKAILISLAVLGIAAVGFRLSRTSARQGVPVAPLSSDVVRSVALGQTVNCLRLLTPPTLDGQPTDWAVGDTITLDRNTAYSFSGQIDNTADLSASARSGWDDEYLYFLVQVTDQTIVTDSTDVWRDDGVEFGLDGLHDQLPWGLDDHQYTVVADGRLADRAVATTAISAAVLRYPGGYNVELAVPISQLIPGTPISGTVVGFTLGLHDDDDGGNWDAYLIWQGTDTGTSPDEFGGLVFVERVEDRLAVLEARITKLEERIRELLAVLGEFEQVTLPTLRALGLTPVPTETPAARQIETPGSSPAPGATPSLGVPTLTLPPVMPAETTTPVPGP